MDSYHLECTTADYNEVETCINHAPSRVHFCKKCAQKGLWLMWFTFRITLPRQVQVILSKMLWNWKRNSKCDWLQRNESGVYHYNCLPGRYIAWTVHPSLKGYSTMWSFWVKLSSRRAILSGEAKNKQHVWAFSGVQEHYSELFTWMAAWNAVAQSLVQLSLSLLHT